MAPLPGNLDSLPDGDLDEILLDFENNASEIFEEGPDFCSNEAKTNQNIVDNFYELVQIRPTIVDDLVEWKFLESDWMSENSLHDDPDYADEPFAVLSEEETYEEWFRRLITPLASPAWSESDLSNSLLDSPWSAEYDGRLWTSFTSSLNEGRILILVRDDNGELRVFTYFTL